MDIMCNNLKTKSPKKHAACSVLHKNELYLINYVPTIYGKSIYRQKETMES